ncbi:DegT/DnrJ/EryC1/StrS family aminotransferase [Halorhodospira halophila]|uniref:DegT/DnrJ/EryC1/StrS aminotransferase n=1 Tax=Halorhodospira halophila (strain DSM 244 / SL1) TaxID=349124 RepID=A1WXB9_HALHL|nr:DegT/DnrJ/EryC1/StrS family aminotransferase [Halorhodospira halophila]ABM62331.1 DegT/DnrJ/EryC1/StrS aminotransferase [Halorhodospira halophila SL1]MBK1730068.1 DegT/DnrJ/EryC1/StrS aminotransferase family protein [Halorhodospira halophila]
MPAIDPIPKMPLLTQTLWRGTGRDKLHYPSVLDRPNLYHFNWAREGLEMALRALGLKPNDEVLLPAYHCLSMITPVLRAGGQPTFYPVQADTRIEVSELSRHITARTRVVIAPYFFGFDQPMSAIRELCDRSGVTLIEDCAHALYGTPGGQPVGSIGHYAVASPWKFLPVTRGGCLVVNDPVTHPAPKMPAGPTARAELKDGLNTLERSMDYGRLPLLNPFLRPILSLSEALSRRRHSTQGVEADSRPLDESIAWADPPPAPLSRVGRWLLQHSDRMAQCELRREYYLRLAEAWRDLPGATLLHRRLPDHVVPQVVPLTTRNPRDFAAALLSEGIPVIRFGGQLWPRTPPQTCTNAPMLSACVFQFPCHPSLTTAEVDSIARRVRAILLNTPSGTPSPRDYGRSAEMEQP